MTEILKADHIAVVGKFEDISFAVAHGELLVLLTSKEEINTTLTRLLLGATKPDGGDLTLFGRDIASLSHSELLKTRQRIGVVFTGGGLVSNLKAWENLTLPLDYHSALGSAVIEERGAAILQRVGYKGRLMDLPGHLSLYQKRQIGLGRAMLTDPDLMIFESPSQGLNQDERQAFMEVARSFHAGKPGRASLFLTSNQAIVELLQDARVVDLRKRQAA
jgi:ABC-type transporter Mla maintaining outer membrane lipid asymmetry ATPase subunit MlaF